MSKPVLDTMVELMSGSGVKPFGHAMATWEMGPSTFLEVCHALNQKAVLSSETRIFGYPVQVEGRGDESYLCLTVRNGWATFAVPEVPSG